MTSRLIVHFDIPRIVRIPNPALTSCCRRSNKNRCKNMFHWFRREIILARTKQRSAHSSAGQSAGLRSQRSEVRILLGAPFSCYQLSHCDVFRFRLAPKASGSYISSLPILYYLLCATKSSAIAQALSAGNARQMPAVRH